MIKKNIVKRMGIIGQTFVCKSYTKNQCIHLFSGANRRSTEVRRDPERGKAPTGNHEVKLKVIGLTGVIGVIAVRQL